MYENGKKCNKSVNNEFKIMRESLFNYFFNSLFWYNEFTEVREDSLHFDSVMNLIHYELISVTWSIRETSKTEISFKL